MVWGKPLCERHESVFVVVLLYHVTITIPADVMTLDMVGQTLRRDIASTRHRIFALGCILTCSSAAGVSGFGRGATITGHSLHARFRCRPVPHGPGVASFRCLCRHVLLVRQDDGRHDEPNRGQLQFGYLYR